MSSPPAPPPPDAPAAASASSSYSPPISDSQMRLMKSINFVVGALQQYIVAKKKQTEAAKSNQSVSVQESPDLSAFLGAAQELKALQKRMEQMNRNTTRPLSQFRRRRALLIGNNDYVHVGALRFCVKDAGDMTGVLLQMGFSCDVRPNLNSRNMHDEIRKFTDSLEDDDLAFFYFSGHGSQIDQRTYLLPVDLTMESDVQLEGYSLELLATTLGRREHVVSVLVVDCCRSAEPRAPLKPKVKPEPGAGAPTEAGDTDTDMEDTASVASSSSVQLLTKPQYQSECRDALTRAARSGSGEVMVLFSSSPGQSSFEDPAARNGRFTGCLLRHLAQPGVDIETICREVNLAMYTYEALQLKPRTKQQPWRLSTALRHKLVLMRHK